LHEILILSGKGGTGKTSLASSFISLAGQCIACDYDVDASNLPIVLNPQVGVTVAFSGGVEAWIDDAVCIGCGLCESICRFEAISNLAVEDMACEGCGFCARICPVDAIKLRNRPSGKWFRGITPDGTPVYYAELKPGEENSGKLVSEVKNAARQAAKADNIPLIISDGPPGIGCAAIASLVAVDLVVVVAEPSVSGFSDLRRVYELLSSRGVKSTLIINKYDINEQLTDEIVLWANEHDIPLAGLIPFNTALADTIAKGKVPIIVDEVRNMISPIWREVINQL